MAGGRGERFWPCSRLKRPKHLLPIIGNSTLLTQTIDRLAGFIPPENILVLTNSEQIEEARKSSPRLAPEQFVAEPVGRDTAPAAALASLLVKQRDPDAAFAILPADHVIHDIEKYQAVLSATFEAAEAEPVLATIGIKPSEPATGFGYIQRGAPLLECNGRAVYKVERFVEKPEMETAERYIADGSYYWNAGMFIWRVSTIESAFAQHAPTLVDGFAKIEAALSAGSSMDDALAEHFPAFEKISIDYAIMEKADNVVVIESDFDWDDVGAWPAICHHFPSDDKENTIVGDAIIQDGSNNLVVSKDGHLTALLGVDDLIVVHTEDATLVCRKDRAQDIKELVKKLAEKDAWKQLL